MGFFLCWQEAILQLEQLNERLANAKMRNLVFLGLVGLMLAMANGVENAAKPATESVRYLALGDSYTIGESVDEAARWPMQLRDSLLAHSVEVEWYKLIAHNGWRTRDLKEAIDQCRPDKNYNLVSLQIGVNDYFQGRGLDEYKQRFQQLLETAVAHAGGRKERVFVLSIPDYSYSPKQKDQIETVSKGIDDFNNINKKITLAAGIHYIDVTAISRRGLSHPDWICADGLHPSATQYAAWVKAMLPAVLEMVGE